MSGVRAGWERFWFAPASTAPIEVFRIAFGIVTTAWVLSLVPVLVPFFGPSPALPESPELPLGGWTFFTLVQGSTVALWAFWLVALVATVCVTIGYRTRLAAVLVFAVLVSVQRQAPVSFNSGDGLLRVLSFYLVLSPAGTAVSVDRWLLRRPDPWAFPLRAPWSLRLLQIQLSVIYLSTVWEKLQGALWREGTAVSFALRIADVGRAPTPGFVTDSPVLVELMTFGTLALELSIAVLVWNRVARPWVLGLGAVLHLAIEVQLAVGFFSPAVLTLYLAFLPADRAERILRAGGKRARALRERVRSGRGAEAPAREREPRSAVPRSSRPSGAVTRWR